MNRLLNLILLKILVFCLLYFLILNSKSHWRDSLKLSLIWCIKIWYIKRGSDLCVGQLYFCSLGKSLEIFLSEQCANYLVKNTYFSKKIKIKIKILHHRSFQNVAGSPNGVFACFVSIWLGMEDDRCPCPKLVFNWCLVLFRLLDEETQMAWMLICDTVLVLSTTEKTKSV